MNEPATPTMSETSEPESRNSKRVRDRLAHALADWRLWASLSACGAILCVGLALKSTVDQNHSLREDNDQLTDQVTNVADVNLCRSRSAVFAESAVAVQDSLVALGLSAVGRNQPTAPYADALDAARRNTAVALTARDTAVESCQADPGYLIDPAILEPLPSFPQPLKG